MMFIHIFWELRLGTKINTYQFILLGYWYPGILLFPTIKQEGGVIVYAKYLLCDPIGDIMVKKNWEFLFWEIMKKYNLCLLKNRL